MNPLPEEQIPSQPLEGVAGARQDLADQFSEGFTTEDVGREKLMISKVSGPSMVVTIMLAERTGKPLYIWYPGGKQMSVGDDPAHVAEIVGGLLRNP